MKQPIYRTLATIALVLLALIGITLITVKFATEHLLDEDARSTARLVN